MIKNTSRDSKIIEMYNNGDTYSKISEYFGFKNNVPMILKALRRNNIEVGLGRYPTRSKNSKDVDLSFFELIDTKEKAYILGLIYSDGSIDKDGYGFSFVSKDYDQVYLLKSLLKSDHKICLVNSHDKRTNKTYSRYTIHICSKKMTTDLKNLGLHNSKSFSCNFPKIDMNYIWHFIRGLFDGDGCITKMHEKEGCLSFSMILSGELKDKIKDFFNERGMSPTKDQVKFKNMDGSISSLKYSSYKDLKFIYDNIYEDSNELRLERKYELFTTLKEYKRGVYVRKLRTIYQYDSSMNLVNIYKNINEIEFTKGKVYNSLKTGKKHRGFFFSYTIK